MNHRSARVISLRCIEDALPVFDIATRRVLALDVRCYAAGESPTGFFIDTSGALCA